MAQTNQGRCSQGNQGRFQTSGRRRSGSPRRGCRRGPFHGNTRQTPSVFKTGKRPFAHGSSRNCRRSHERAKIRLPTVVGSVDLIIPPASQGGQLYKLKGKGAPDPKTGKAGDLILKLVVKLPRSKDEKCLKAASEIDQYYDSERTGETKNLTTFRKPPPKSGSADSTKLCRPTVHIFPRQAKFNGWRRKAACACQSLHTRPK